MKEVYIKLQTINDVRKLVSVVEKYPFSVDLSEGRYLVDAKSLMGIFSLDLLQPIKLIAEKDDPNLFEELKDIINTLLYSYVIIAIFYCMQHIIIILKGIIGLTVQDNFCRFERSSFSGLFIESHKIIDHFVFFFMCINPFDRLKISSEKRCNFLMLCFHRILIGNYDTIKSCV